jgi:hypothetical protein
VPTATDACATVRLVIAGAAGTVIVTVPGFVESEIEVAVTVIVCAELVAAGTFKVVEVVVEPDRVPALVVQFTPAAFVSLATVAVIVVVSVPSTVFEAAVALTLIGWELAPHPDRPNVRRATSPKNTTASVARFTFPPDMREFRNSPDIVTRGIML